MRVITLCQDSHRVIDLDIHVVTNFRQLFPFRTNNFAVLGFDFPGRRTLGCESATDNNRVPEFPVPIRFIASVLQLNTDLSSTRGIKGSSFGRRKARRKGIRTSVLHE